MGPKAFFERAETALPRHSFKRGVAYILLTSAIGIPVAEHVASRAGHQVSTELQPTLKEQSRALQTKVQATATDMQAQATDMQDTASDVQAKVQDIVDIANNVSDEVAAIKQALQERGIKITLTTPTDHPQDHFIAHGPKPTHQP